jgi:7-cyano-7-deazaguanine reductase
LTADVRAQASTGPYNTIPTRFVSRRIPACPANRPKPSKPSRTRRAAAISTSTWRFPEFTCLCPKTGQPDFATLTLDYIPDQTCVELKSLKLYIWSFRNEGCFHEAVTNRILDDLVAATAPLHALTAKFYVRGGIFTNVVAEHRKKGWKPQRGRTRRIPQSIQAPGAES